MHECVAKITCLFTCDKDATCDAVQLLGRLLGGVYLAKRYTQTA